MHYSIFAVASLALLPSFIAAHGGGIPGAPRVFGRRTSRRFESGNFVRERSLAHNADAEAHAHSVRQAASTNTEGQCGAGFGSCAAGYCCSEAGWCGQGTQYCAAPGCQFNYGPSCDDNTVPSGANTSTVARPKNGNVAYGGAGIYDCTVPGTIALTYDDGPYIYTNDILDVLKNYSAKATFFITGNNNGKGEIDNAANGWSTVVQRAYNEGHQIASHTWTHPHLSNLTSLQRKQNMWSNEMALRNILGFFPTYMRPPYSDCTAASGCQDDMAELGYHITYFDVDTDDYDNDSPALAQKSKNNFDAGIAGGSSSTSDYLVIGHDIHEQTAHNLTAYMLQTLLSQGYKAVTVGECLGDPEENWYRNSSGNVFTRMTSAATPTSSTSTLAASATAVSTDATCGGSSGSTCTNSAFGNCCSSAGWCGSGESYCGEGCQAGFGSCGINLSQSSSVVAGVSTTVSSTAVAATATGISQDASCGGITGLTCRGSVFGNCCSINGFCGSTEAYCGIGCQSGFGACSGSTSSTTAVSSLASTVATQSSITSARSTIISTRSTVSTQAVKTTSAQPTSTISSQRSNISNWLSSIFNRVHHQ